MKIMGYICYLANKQKEGITKKVISIMTLVILRLK